MRLRTITGRLATSVLAIAGLVSSVGASAAGRATSDLVHRHWSVEDGLPQSSANDLVEGGNGYLWIATNGGLARFDGTDFDVVPLAGGDGRLWLRIIRILEDRHGRLWVGTEDQGVGYLEDDTLTVVAGLADGVVTSLAEGVDGRIWVGRGDRGLAVVDPDTATVVRAMSDVVEGGVDTLATAVDGAVWAGGIGELARFGAEGGVDRFGTAETAPDARILDLAPAHHGGVWVASSGAGVIRFTDRVVEQYSVPQGLGSHHHGSVFEDRSGAVWVGEYPGSVRRIVDGRVELVRSSEELHGGPVRALLEDSGGSVWIGTSSGGLHRLTAPLFDVWNRATADLPVDAALAVTEDRNGVVWAGLNCGGILRIAGDQATRFTAEGQPPGDCVWSLLAADDGSLWVGSWGGGVGRFVDGRLSRPIATPELGDEAAVLALFEDSRGGIWLGARGSGALRWSDGRLDRLGMADGLPSDDVRCFAEDDLGRVWIGTTAGLARTAEDHLDPIPDSIAWPGARVRALLVDHDGRIWIGTYGSGLGLIDGDRLHVFDRRHGLADPVVSGILEDDRGHLWLSGNRGIFRIPMSELGEVVAGRRAAVVPAAFGTDHGLPTLEAAGGFQPSAWKASDGRLFFPTIGGLVAIRPSRLERGAVPKAWIEAVVVDGARVAGVEARRLSPINHRVDIRFGGLSLASPGAIAFRYRMIGVDPDWITADSRRSAVYHGLPVGRHRFEVEALTAEGGWSERASVELEVPQVVWLRPWFLVAAAGAILLLPTAGVRWLSWRRERRLRDRAAVLRRLSVGIVHEFRQPLQVLEARLEILSRRVDDERVTASVRRARDAVERLRTLADRIEHLHGDEPLPSSPYAGDEMMVDLGRDSHE